MTLETLFLTYLRIVKVLGVVIVDEWCVILELSMTTDYLMKRLELFRFSTNVFY